MVYTAFEDWSENPIITTLDSIAAPINSIQFPTVTVCTDNEPSDNWAFLDKILDHLAFSCSKSENDCNETEILRNDFESSLEAFINVFLKIRYDEVPKNFFYYYSGYNAMNTLLVQIKNLTLEDKMPTFNDLKKLQVENFAKAISPEEIYKLIG